MSKIEEIKSRYSCKDILSMFGVGYSGKKNICCPLGHADNNPSFSLYNNNQNFKCFSCDKSGDSIELYASLKRCDFKQAVNDLSPKIIGNNMSNNIEAEYVYKTISGEPYQKVVRLKNKAGFPIYHWENNKWMSGKPEIPIPYMLNEWSNASKDFPIWIVEGEKDVDNLFKKLGFYATTNSGGACNFQEELVSYFKDRKIIICPDNDEKGEKHIIDVCEKLQKVTTDITILKIPDLPQKGDISDWISQKEKEGLINEEIAIELQNLYETKKCKFNEIEKKTNAKHPDELNKPILVNGLKTGYVTHDYNDNGLKPGCLTILTGKTGAGKTTYSKSILVAMALQQVNSFMFVGETSIEKEKLRLARLVAPKEEIKVYEGLAGSKNYIPTEKAIEAFDSVFSRYIFLSDLSTLKEIKENKTVFQKILAEMKNLATYFDVKLFILDNLMVMCERTGNNLFSEQKQIALALKQFCEETKTHVILIAHPKKGEGNQDVSGATEVINLADTILRYTRLTDEEKNEFTKDNPGKESFYKRVSAQLLVEKIRDEGRNKPAFFEWEPERGILWDLSDLVHAKSYEEQGLWTRYIGQESKIHW